MKAADAKQLANQLMDEHLDGGFYEGWKFAWSNRKRGYGHVNYTRKILYLSRPLTVLNDYDQVRDTILHEIAHVLAGPAANHGPYWKRVARSLGAVPQACVDGAKLPPTFIGTCPGCGKKFHRFRRTAGSHQLRAARVRRAVPDPVERNVEIAKQREEAA
jgi:predicted SprT family Zn-dependent metalloprotease